MDFNSLFPQKKDFIWIIFGLRNGFSDCHEHARLYIKD
jgi:hypothetical protein